MSPEVSGDSIAEASVSISLDDQALTAELQQLQGKLGPMAQNAAAPLEDIAKGAGHADNGSRRLLGTINQVTHAVGTGNVSIGQMSRQLSQLTTSTNSTVAALGKLGMVATAAYAGWQAGSAIAEKLLGPRNLKAEEIIKVKGQEAAEAFKEGLNESIADMKTPSALKDRDFINTTFGIDQDQLRTALDLQVATAEQAGQDTTKIKADFADQASKALRGNLEEDNKAVAAAVSEIVSEYTSNLAVVENKIKELQSHNIQALGLKPAEAMAAYAADLAQIRDLNAKKKAMAADHEQSLQELHMRQLKNNADMEAADAEAKIAKMQKATDQTGVSSGAGGIWGRAMDIKTAGADKLLGVALNGNKTQAEIKKELEKLNASVEKASKGRHGLFY